MRVFTALLLLAIAGSAGAQTTVHLSSGDVVSIRKMPVDASRLTHRVSGPDSAQLAQVRVGADSAQRIAMADFEWRGRVTSVEFDAADSRLFWDVKIAPDNSDHTLVRYRVDALEGGIMDIREFGDLPRRKRSRP